MEMYDFVFIIHHWYSMC